MSFITAAEAKAEVERIIFSGLYKHHEDAVEEAAALYSEVLHSIAHSSAGPELAREALKLEDESMWPPKRGRNL